MVVKTVMWSLSLFKAGISTLLLGVQNKDNRIGIRMAVACDDAFLLRPTSVLPIFIGNPLE